MFTFGQAAKTANEKITGALDLFTNALTELNEGVELSQVEIKETETTLEADRVAFEAKEVEAKDKIAANTADIAKATKVKNNIEKLLAA